MTSARKAQQPDKALSFVKMEAGNGLIPALSSGKREWNSSMDDAVLRSMERHGHTSKPWGYVYGGLRKMNLAPVLKDANEKLATMGEGPITKKQMIDRWESVLCDEAKECAAVRSLSRKDYEDLVKAIAKDVQPENAPSGSVSLHPIGGSKGTTGCGWNWTKVMEGFNRQRLQEGKPRLTKQKLRNFYYTCKDAVKRNYSYANEESLASWPLIEFCREQKGSSSVLRDKKAKPSSALSCDNERQQAAGAASCSVSSEKRGEKSQKTPRNGAAPAKDASIRRPTPRRPDRAGIAGITPLATITNLPNRIMGSATSTVAATPCPRGSSFGFQKASDVVTPSPLLFYNRKRQSLSSELQDSAFAPIMRGRSEAVTQPERRHSKAQKTAAAVEEHGTLPVFPLLAMTPCGSGRQNTAAAAAAAPDTSSILDGSQLVPDASHPESNYLNMVVAAAEFLKTVDAQSLPRDVREKVGKAVFHLRPPLLSSVGSGASVSPSGIGAPVSLSGALTRTNHDT